MSIAGDSIYREIILDHYQNPRNRGILDPNDYTYEDNNPLCGDEVRIDVRVKDGAVDDIAFSGQGCAISQASASILMELVEGKSLDEVKMIGKEELLEELGIELSPARLKCALLSLKVLKAGLYGIDKANEEIDEL
ncbi:MAG: SUF system NifU family Fe-S cluster assembly protein [Chloroflexota bacterium]|jgi:nitrogen fixation NifU-like protein|nr:SUF system NifU family Fe-S cluster assembly protein [Chloroflexota bacterium]